ncbi:MAG: 3-isopropylmalate dehydratase small subunit [Oligoflexus sp.]
MKDAIKTINGYAVHIPGPNLDTDRIVPARFLKTVSFSELAAALFFDDRMLPSGNPDPAHPLHREPKPEILVVDKNFGCGSSREHAAQAIKLWGIKAILGRSFGDIFRGNCQHLGVPCISISAASHQEITEYLGKEAKALTIDLSDLRVSAAGAEQNWPCELSADSQRVFLEGTYDPLQALLMNQEAVLRFSRKHPAAPSRFI